MKNIFIFSILLLIVVPFLYMGCGVGIISGIGTTLTTVEIAGEVAKKVDDIHKSGADKKILDDVRDALIEAHQIIDKHHKREVRDKK